MNNSYCTPHNIHNKDKYSQSQIKTVFEALSKQPKTMLMVANETGIERAYICRHIAKLMKQSKVIVVMYNLCEVSQHRAGYYTTNTQLIKSIVPPSKKFKI